MMVKQRRLVSFVERERGVTLLQHSSSLEIANRFWQLVFMMVFDHEESIFVEQFNCVRVEKLERTKIVVFVGWVEKDDIPAWNFSGDRLMKEI